MLPVLGAVIDTVGAVALFTVMVLTAVAWALLLPVATAVIVKVPSVVGVQFIV